MTREEAINEIKSWAIPSKNGREVLETLIPELRENEDERIRKHIVKFIDEQYPTHGNLKEEKDKMLAYLEKQKEEEGYEAIPVESTLEYKLGFKAGKESENQKESLRDFIDDFPYSYEQKEQKPLTDEEKEYIRTIKSIISDFIRDKKPEDLAYYQRIYDWLDERHVPFSCGHENGKSAEWGKEDDRMLESLLWHLRYSINGGDVDHTAGQIEEWLNGRLKTPSLQQKQEWSEEDEKTINDACCWIAEYAGYLMDKNYGKASMLMGLTDKLKFLRPSWKPNKEQMEALNALNCHGDLSYVGQQNQLISLYNDLKKLM